MRKGSTSFGACEVRCWRWLFGNKIPVSRSRRARAYGAYTVVSLDLRLKGLFRTCVESNSSQCKNLAEMRSGSEEGSYLRLVDCCITQL